MNDGIIIGLLIGLSFFAGWAVGMYMMRASLREMQTKILAELREENKKNKVM